MSTSRPEDSVRARPASAGMRAASPPASTPAFVALSSFVVANGMTDEVKAAFRARPHLVDDAPGFVRMEVISPAERPEEIWLLTYWTDEASFRSWHRSHLYREAHAGIPKGLKLVHAETRIRHFDHVAS